MLFNTREQFHHYCQQLATLNKVKTVYEQYNVEPSIQQKLEKKIREKADFLNRINIIPVVEKVGAVIKLGVDKPIASRDPTGQRDPKAYGSMTQREYRCEKINYDSFVSYDLLDTWAGEANFARMLRSLLIEQYAHDRLMIGFNGLRCEAKSDPVANPLLQDVAIGWLQHWRNDAPDRVMTEVASGSGKVKVGEKVTSANGYKTLSALVSDACANLINSWTVQSKNLHIICGRKIAASREFEMLNRSVSAVEMEAAQRIVSEKKINDLPIISPPYFPENSILITPLSNLSIYYQKSGRRSLTKDAPEKDRIETYESSNDAFVVQEYGDGCLIENIEIEAE